MLQGAFTLWNMQADDRVVISAHLAGLSAGREGAPVRGGGIFVSGAGFTGGRLVAPLLETGAVYSDGDIPEGTPDQITGGVFTVSRSASRSGGWWCIEASRPSAAPAIRWSRAWS